MLLVGSTVAFLNPLIGIGIAAAGILPAVGGKTTKAGAAMIGDRLRSKDKEKKTAQALKEAKGDLRRLEPEIFPNPLLQNLDALITNPSSDHDPFLDNGTQVDSFESYRNYHVGVEGIAEVYQSLIEKHRKDIPLTPVAQKWIEHIISLRDELKSAT